jgi:hypothetical protein
VKYVILIYSNPATWAALPPEEADRVIGDHFTMIRELTESGELVTQFGLADGSTAKLVRNVSGAAAVTDGPFGEAKELLLGVFVIDVENEARAVEVSTPLSQHAVVEIRPIMVEAGSEM